MARIITTVKRTKIPRKKTQEQIRNQQRKLTQRLIKKDEARMNRVYNSKQYKRLMKHMEYDDLHQAYDERQKQNLFLQGRKKFPKIAKPVFKNMMNGS